jgi:hypothetical protein
MAWKKKQVLNSNSEHASAGKYLAMIGPELRFATVYLRSSSSQSMMGRRKYFGEAELPG